MVKYKEEFSNIDFTKVSDSDPYKDMTAPENLSHILLRCKNLDDYLKKSKHQNIIIVSHWAFISDYMKYFLKKNNIKLNNCEYIKIEFEK